MFGKGVLKVLVKYIQNKSKMEVFVKIINDQKHYLFSQNASSKIFDRVLEMLLILTGNVLALLIRYLLAQS